MQNWEYIRLGVSYSTRSITTHDSVYELVDVYSNGIKILSQTKSLDLYDYLNKVGTEGWELVNIHLGRGKFDEVYYLKRPVSSGVGAFSKNVISLQETQAN